MLAKGPRLQQHLAHLVHFAHGTKNSGRRPDLIYWEADPLLLRQVLQEVPLHPAKIFCKILGDQDQRLGTERFGSPVGDTERDRCTVIEADEPVQARKDACDRIRNVYHRREDAGAERPFFQEVLQQLLGRNGMEDGHIGHGAVLHGCRVERNGLVGMNAVVNDNVTSDAIALQSERVPAGASDRLVSGAAYSPGHLGSFWVTDLRLYNPGSTPLDATTVSAQTTVTTTGQSLRVARLERS